MTLAEIRGAVDTWLAPRWATVQTLQAAYLAAHGRYFQGLITHSAMPPDGASTPPDRLLVKPTDQSEAWGDFLALPATLPCGLLIDVYDGPQGKGFAATVFVVVLGTLYARTVQVGPEAWRVQPWAVMPLGGGA